MKYLLPLALLLPGAAWAQSTSSDRLPPANPLPYEDADFAAVMAPLNAWFAGIDHTDAAAIRQQIRIDGGGGATVAGVRANGEHFVRHIAWEDYLANIKPGEHHYQERFTSQPAIEVDGDIAMVWGEFTLLQDGKPVTCGVDHFDLVRENGAWKVQNVTWSQRTTGCPAQ